MKVDIKHVLKLFLLDQPNVTDWWPEIGDGKVNHFWDDAASEKKKEKAKKSSLWSTVIEIEDDLAGIIYLLFTNLTEDQIMTNTVKYIKKHNLSEVMDTLKSLSLVELEEDSEKDDLLKALEKVSK